jgi:hypothetical protein
MAEFVVDLDQRRDLNEGPRLARSNEIAGLRHDHEATLLRFGGLQAFGSRGQRFRRQRRGGVEAEDKPRGVERAVSLSPAGERLVDVGGRLVIPTTHGACSSACGRLGRGFAGTVQIRPRTPTGAAGRGDARARVRPAATLGLRLMEG